MRFKEYDQNQTFLLPPSLEEFVPAGHLTRIINEVVNTLDLNVLYAVSNVLITINKKSCLRKSKTALENHQL